MTKNVRTVKLLVSFPHSPLGGAMRQFLCFITDILLCFFPAGGAEFFNVSFWAKCNCFSLVKTLVCFFSFTLISPYSQKLNLADSQELPRAATV